MIKKALVYSRDKMLSSINHRFDSVTGNFDRVLQYITTVDHRVSDVDTRVVAIEKRVVNSGTVHIREGEVITKIFSGIKMYLDPRDLAVAAHIVLDGVWEEQISKAWLSVVGRSDTVFDVGANFGYYGALAAQHTDKKNSKIVLFEANKNLIPYIERTLSLNWFNEQSRVEHVAISDAPGELELHVLGDYVGCSTLQDVEQVKGYAGTKMNFGTTESQKVRAVTIDDYCAENKIERIDLMKMDIEGFEEKAYQGMRKMVKKSPNLKLFIEFTKDSYENPSGLYNQILKDFGHVYLIDKDGALYKPASTSYESVIGDASDWVMPVFSKKEIK